MSIITFITKISTPLILCFILHNTTIKIRILFILYEVI
jgi:hypothetical protein